MKSGKDSRQLLNGNKVTLRIPGFKSDLSIQFPNRRLPVCEKCKRHYKTRNLCRVKKMHTDLPWCKTFLCITLNESCIDGENKIAPGPYEAKTTNWRPYQFKASVPMNCDFPMCADCKRKNYTGSYCRGRQHAHRYLPWDSVYVELSSLHSTSKGGTDGDNAGSPDESVSDKKISIKATKIKGGEMDEDESSAGVAREKSGLETHDNLDGKSTNSGSAAAASAHERSHKSTVAVGEKSKLEESDEQPRKKAKAEKNEDDKETHELENIDKSRTFFLEVSSTSCKIQWLDLDEDRALALAESNANNPSQNDREDPSQQFSDHNMLQDPYRNPDYAQTEQNSYYQYAPPPPYSVHQPWNQMYYHQYPHQSPQAFNHGTPPLYNSGPPSYAQNTLPVAQPDQFNQYYPPYFSPSAYGYPVQGTPQRENFQQESTSQAPYSTPLSGAGYSHQLSSSQRDTDPQEPQASYVNPPTAAANNDGAPRQTGYEAPYQGQGIHHDASPHQEPPDNYNRYPGNLSKQEGPRRDRN